MMKNEVAVEGAPNCEVVEELQPIDIFADPLSGRPELRVSVLPDPIADFAADEAERLGVDPGLLALPALSASAAAIHDGLRIQPKANDSGWTESARLWIAIVADSGERKSPALSKALRPLRQIEAQWTESDTAALRRYELEMRRWSRETDRWTNRSEGADPPAQPIRPAQRRLMVEDTTVEALSMVLADNPGGVLCVRDELSAWFGSFDSYRERGPVSKDRADWLSSWNGGPRGIDRVRRGRVMLENWGVSIVGTIQPGPMRRIAAKLQDDGLLQRFIVAFVRPGGEEQDRRPNTEATAAYHTAIERLLSLTELPSTRFVLSTAAQAKRRLVIQTIARIRLMPDISAAFRAHLSKLDAIYARLLLIFHLLEWAGTTKASPSEEVSERTADDVARFTLDYLVPHAAHFYSHILGNEHLEQARWIAGHILAHGLEKISARDIGRVYRRLRDDSVGIARVMDSLTLSGWVTPLAANGGAPSALSRWKVNQAVHAVFADRANRERQQREEMVAKIKKAVSELSCAGGLSDLASA